MAIKAKLPLLLFFFGSFLLAFTSSLAYEKDNNADPQREYQQCLRRCQEEETGQRQQKQCMQHCEKLREQEIEGRRGEDNGADPQREYQQCQTRCQREESGQRQQQQCMQHCEKLREQEREGRRGEDKRADPQREYQQCQTRCQKEERGQRQQQQCQRRCEEEQEREGRRGEDNRADPQREYQQCRTRCQREERGQRQQQQCQQRCEEELREQEREGRRGEDNRADPQRVYQQCRTRCQREERGQRQQQQCQQRCEEELREQEREGRRGEDNRADPQREYQQCQTRCQREERGQRQQQQCQQGCEEELREQEREGRRGGDPQRQYQRCQSRCQQQERGQQQQRQCQQRCEEILREREREERRGEDNNADPQREYQQFMRRCQQQGGELKQQCIRSCQQQEESNNPYFFDEQSFIEKYRTEEGRIRILPKFTQRSDLHRGIENYRLEIFEANPNTFVIPNHCDADAVIYVVKGKGTISMINKENRDSINLERGDVIRVPSGSVVYMVNRGDEQLWIAKLYLPIFKTGHFQEFFGVGGEEPESFYKTFSNEVLEAAFNTRIDRLKRLFGQQKEGVIIRASKEQVEALSKHASRGPYNILNSMPAYSNNHGKLYEVKPSEYRQLQDLDVAVSFVNITKGAMMVPYYNTRATKLILVVEGRGRFEMAERKQEHKEGGAHYQRVNASLSPKTMFIVPTGHPVTIIASDNENLLLVEFTINAQYSNRNFLAGMRGNVVSQMEEEAIELGFNLPSKEAESIYRSQMESVFVPGPNQRRQQRERGSHGLSILDLVNF